jgi:Leucine-rich repeat (LRR) protein
MKRRPVKIANGERSALDAFRNATSFAGWINKTGWEKKALLDVDGVDKELDGVDLYNGRAINIDLSQNCLTGRLPDVFARFTQITELFLNNNGLTGPIPSSICECPKLRVLNLSDNQFSGQVPSNVWKLLKIEVVYLHNNILSGVIDEWIKGTVAWEVRLDGNNYKTTNQGYQPGVPRLLRHGRFSTEAVDLKSITSMRAYLADRLKEEGGDLKLWAVDRLLVSGLRMNKVIHLYTFSNLCLPLSTLGSHLPVSDARLVGVCKSISRRVC